MMASPSDPRQAYLRDLGAAHGFTLEELEMNRQGRLHPAQAKRGKSSGIGGGVFLLLLGLLVAAGGVGGALYLYDDYSKPISDIDMNGLYALGGGGVVLGGLLGIGALLTFRKVGARRKAYAQSPALVAQGPLQKVHIDGRGGMPSQWRYVIGGVAFVVSQKAWELTTHGAHYRVYHLVGDLLSIEPL
ncbi:hypothetical protein WMF28_30170 [Sorangium sp. So ce590]|uniref:hypothetical protein n=1 Tax=Sorangium sp. So ce590 TaxID=3133317 RepID=UPI003F5D8B90